MGDVDYTLDVFKQFRNRSLPLLARPDAPRTAPDTQLPDLNNVQGDVLYLFPKVSMQF